MDEAIVSYQKKAKPLDVLFVNLPSYTPEPANSKNETFGENMVPPLGLLYLANSIKDCSFVSSYQCADFGIAKLNGYVGKKHLVGLVNKKLKETEETGGILWKLKETERNQRKLKETEGN